MDAIFYCPKDPEHDEFHITAHVAQGWAVDGKGNWISTIDDCSQVIHGPDKDDLWICAICGAEAEYREDEE